MAAHVRVLSGLLVLASVVCATGQPNSNDAGARAILDRAIDTLGGRAQLETTDRWYIEGRGRENLSAELQGIAPDRPTWRPHEEKLAVDRAAGAVAWERRTPRNDDSLRWRRFIYTSAGTSVIDWTASRYWASQNVQPAAGREALMRRIPHLIVLEAATRATHLAHAGTRQVGRMAHDAIDATLANRRFTLLFSRNPVLLARIEYTVHLPGRGDVVVTWSWDGWARAANGDSHVWAPARHAVDIAGTPFQEVAYTRFETASSDATAMIAASDRPSAPPPGTTSAPPPAGLASGEVAPGVHVAVVRGFTVMFVEFKDFVVALDAPEPHPGFEGIPARLEANAGTLTRDYLALISKTIPGKPVRYVVVSHHHSDHMGGAAEFAAAGATILAAPSHVAAVRDAVKDPAVPVEAVRSRRAITDGRRTIDIINAGPNPHTQENLFAWLPRERLVFQADLFYYSEGASFPPSGREIMNRFFAEWLRRHNVAPAAIYGVHNRGAASPDAVELSRRDP